jgi:hypothetical protein
MKKLVIMIALVMSVGTLAKANCGNDKGVGNGCSNLGQPGQPGQPGGVGGQGGQGGVGQDGLNGATGPQGVAGKNGTDAQVDNSAKLVVDTAVRLYDGKYVQLQAFNTYAFDRHDAHDVSEEFHNSRNFMFGARIVLKLGKSYEERLLEKQDTQIKSLERLVSRLAR